MFENLRSHIAVLSEISDEEFEYLRSNEMVLIFKSAFERYTISESKLIRYADRKRKKKLLIDFLDSNKIKETN